MEVPNLPLIKAVPLDFRPRCLCRDKHIEPAIARFGGCVLCIREPCLTAWIIAVSQRMAAAKFRVDFIRHRGPEEWGEFLQTFLTHAWERIVLYGQAGLGHFDIANAARSFMGSRVKQDRDQPNSLVTQPVDEVADWDDTCGDEVAQDTIRGLIDYHSPYEALRISEVVHALADPVLVMEVAEQITTADAALLRDTSVLAYQQYRDRVVAEVRTNATQARRQA